jgi:cation diffusion facilitator CzcD-associated flavoprotein CzcO
MRVVEVLVIGAGVGGIAAAVKLEQAHVTDFLVCEQSDGPGGTWWDNRYPGCEVDIHSDFYSFSFMPHAWSGSHAGQAELQRYTEATIDRFGIRDRMRFGCKVESVAWDGSTGTYLARLGGGGEVRARFVVSAVGFLNVPNQPAWTGLETFGGETWHTARWRDDIDLEGRTVAVVGTGSTAAQLVPALAPKVGRLVQFQRSPGWILPKNEVTYSPAQLRRRKRVPLLQLLSRYGKFRTFSKFVTVFDTASPIHADMTRDALAFIDQEIESPEVRAAVTPAYPIGCKRIILATTYYASLNRENVTLVPTGVQRVTERGVVDGNGVEHEVDVIIAATGFRAWDYLATLDVTGVDGVRLHDAWGDRKQSFLGITVSGFPNFFMIYGPNTNGGGSIIYQNEKQAEVAVRSIVRARRRHAVVDTDPLAVEWWTTWLDRDFDRNYDSQQLQNCHSYFHSPSGRNVSLWPRTHRSYATLARVLPRVGLRFARKPATPAAVTRPRATTDA